MTLRISTRYRTSSDVKLLKFSYQISDTMGENPVYDNPTPTQLVLHGACDSFRLACSVSNRRDRALLSAKNDRKYELVALLDQLNIYVTDKCKGDKTMLLQSGFELVGLKNESQVLKPITEVEVISDLPGTATIRVTRVTGAKSYVFQYTADPLSPDSVWVSQTVLDPRHTFSNLNSVARYWFRVIAVGKGNQNVYSPPVARVIQ